MIINIRELSLNIPLKITRSTIYMVIMFTSVMFILLPWSVVSYIKFYHTLIPISRISIPLNFEYRLSNPFATVSRAHLVSFLETDIEYNFNLRLEAYCLTAKYESIPISQSVAISDLTQVDHMVSKSDKSSIIAHNGLDTLSRSSSILHCDPRVNYYKYNLFIPFYWRNFLPPFLTTIENSNNLKLKLFTEYGGEVLTKMSSPSNVLLVEFDRLFAIDSNSYLDITVNWEGIRYYIYNYRIICFVLGVTVFWTVSSVVCFAVSWGIWFYVGGYYVSNKEENVDEINAEDFNNHPPFEVIG